MDEEISIINTNTRNEKIKNFFIKNKKKLSISIFFIILLTFSLFIYQDFKNKNKIKLAEKYNLIAINFISGDQTNVENQLVDIVMKKDITYSPLALYFLIDNNIITEKDKLNQLFDVIINGAKLEKEIKNLLIYKKGLYNSEFESENNLIKILNPIINSESRWKSHALYLMAEYFYNKNEKLKSKEFFNRIVILKNSNKKINLEAQKRLSRDFGE
jgi:predicted negative regulator of RcsB-dependent stress response